MDRRKYLERQRRYNDSEKGQARRARYEETRVQFRMRGTSFSRRVPRGYRNAIADAIRQRVAERRAELMDEFHARQAAELRAFREGLTPP